MPVDFTTYTEVEEIDDIQKTATHVDFIDRRNRTTYLYKDYGADYFGDFVHWLDITRQTHANSASGYFWLISNALKGEQIMRDDDDPYVAVICGGTNPNTRLIEHDALGAFHTGAFKAMTLTTKYYIRIEKVGTSFYLDYFSTANLRAAGGRGDGDWHSDSIVLQADYSMRYLYIGQTHDDNQGIVGSSDMDDLIFWGDPQDLAAGFDVRQPGSEDLPAGLESRQAASQELAAGFSVRRTATPLDLAAGFVVRPSKYWDYEDFTTYTEVDVGANVLRNITPNDYDVVNVDLNQVVHLSRRYGADYFTGDFFHDITANFISGVQNGRYYFWVLADTADSYDGLADGTLAVMAQRLMASNWRIVLYEKGVISVIYTHPNGANYTFYLTVYRKGTELGCRIYSDAARTALIDTLTITLSGSNDFDYLLGCSTDLALNGRDTNLNISDLFFNGGVYSEDLACGFSVGGVTDDSEDLLGEFDVRANVTLDLLGEFNVRQETSLDLAAGFDIRRSVPDYEDFTTYTEYDIGANRIQSVAELSVDMVNVDRDEIGVRLIKDYGPNYFTDFSVKFDAQMTAYTGTGRGYAWGLSNEDADLGQNANPAIGLRVKIATAGADEIQWQLWDLEEPGVQTFLIGQVAELEHNNRRYFTITKRGTTISLSVYSDAARTTLIGTASGTLQADYLFRYAYALSAEDVGQAGGVALTYDTRNHIYERHNLSAEFIVRRSDTEELAAGFVAVQWLPGWGKRVKFSVDNGDIDAALSDFPMLAYLGSSSGINGDDLRFVFAELGVESLKIAVTTDDGETECKVEVEKWDNGAKEAWLWIKAPSISSSVDQEFYLYFDSTHADNTANVGPTNSVPAENVWDADFRAVYHMRDGASTSAIYDSTDNDKDGAKAGANDPPEVAGGQIDGAQDLDGAADYINIGTSVLDGIRTIEVWFSPGFTMDDTMVDIASLVKRNTGDQVGEAGIMVDRSIGAAPGHLIFYIHDQTIVSDSDEWTQDTWYYAAGIAHPADGMMMYVDAVKQADTDAATDASRTEPDITAIGAWGSPYNRKWTGIIDEIRISTSARSEAWIGASHESGQDDLLDWGGEEGRISVDLPCEFIVRQAASQDLAAGFEVRPIYSEDLPAKFVVKRFLFIEDFEKGNTDKFDVVDNAATSADQNHTPGGSLSLKTLSSDDHSYVTKNWGKQQSGQIMSAWFYDDATATVDKAAIFAVHDGVTGLLVGVKTDEEQNNYIYRLDGVWFDSGITRSTGWHRFAFDFRDGATVKLYIDQVKILDVGDPDTFDLLSMGNVWAASDAIGYWDDVNIEFEDLAAEFIVRHPDSEELPAEFVVQVAVPGSANLLGEFDVGQGSEDLGAGFVVQVAVPGSANLPAQFDIALLSDSEDLLTGFGIRVTGSEDLAAEFQSKTVRVAQDLTKWTQYDADEFLDHDCNEVYWTALERATVDTALTKTDMAKGLGSRFFHRLRANMFIVEETPNGQTERVILWAGHIANASHDFYGQNDGEIVALIAHATTVADTYVLELREKGGNSAFMVTTWPNYQDRYIQIYKEGDYIRASSYQSDTYDKGALDDWCEIALSGDLDFNYISIAMSYGQAGAETSDGIIDPIFGAFEGLPAEFVVRQAASEDLAAGFTITQKASQDLAAAFSVTIHSEDLFAKFTARHEDAQDLYGKFAVRRTAVPLELPAEFIARQSASADLPSGFVSNAAGNEDLLAGLIVRHSDLEELFGELIVRHSDLEELLGEFIVRHEVSQELSAGFTVRQPGSQELPSEFVVARSSSQEVPAAFISRQQGSEDLPASFDGQAVISLAAAFTVRHPASQDLPGKFSARREAIPQELAAYFEIRLPLQTLFCKFYVRPLSSEATGFQITDLRRGLQPGPALTVVGSDVVPEDFENFDDYIEIDSDNDITRDGPRTSWDTMRSDAVSYVYEDFGANFWKDFEFDFTLNISEVEAGDSSSAPIMVPIALSNHGPTTFINLGAGPGEAVIACFLRQNGSIDDQFRFVIWQRQDGVAAIPGLSAVYGLGTYYCTIGRTGTNISVSIYSDAARTALLETITLPVGSDAYDYRYIQVSTSNDSLSDPTDYSSGYIENLDTGLAVAIRSTSRELMVTPRRKMKVK